MPTQSQLPEPYATLSNEQLADRIAQRKQQLGKALVILGHHYQRDDVIAHADFTGDSLKLSRLAASQRDAKWIVFCGVHFMAESADILSGPDQAVCLPNLQAGCAMADMADAEGVAAALDEVAALTDAKVVPITYVNSTAAVKAITARAGGACCTSGNVRNAFAWALAPGAAGGAGGEKIFAIPDRHLGQNTAVAMGFDPDECVLYDPHVPDGGLTRPAVARARVLLWKGHCYVHQLFRPEHVHAVRAADPRATIIVHPECPREVVALADAAGSTEQIIRAVADAAATPSTIKSRWAIGTEANLVHRLARRHADQHIRVLADAPARCTQMARIDLPHLAWLLDNLAAGRTVNQITVPDEIATHARVAVQRMIEIKSVDTPTRSPGD